jgi:hypothetical protein
MLRTEVVRQSQLKVVTAGTVESHIEDVVTMKELADTIGGESGWHVVTGTGSVSFPHRTGGITVVDLFIYFNHNPDPA